MSDEEVSSDEDEAVDVGEILALNFAIHTVDFPPSTLAPTEIQLLDVTILWNHPVFQHRADWINEAMTNVMHTECYLGEGGEEKLEVWTYCEPIFHRHYNFSFIAIGFHLFFL